MTEEEKVRAILYRFENAGLITKNAEEVLDCISENILGIGIGEQGFVTSQEDVCRVLETGVKEEDTTFYRLEYGRIESRIHEERFANICAEVRVLSQREGEDSVVMQSCFTQSLTMIKRHGEWKICAMHASTPVVTEEIMNAYPLKFAEKTLQNLKEKIGEEAFLAEEQYRRAILSDTVAFYIINITKNIFEKCQLNSALCAYVEAGAPYEEFLCEKSPEYVVEHDKQAFADKFSVQSIRDAYELGLNEIKLEYQMKCPNGTIRWMLTIMRLITDVATGERKGIMYVKDIDKDKLEEIAIRDRAQLDTMTKVYNKGAMVQRINHLLEDSIGVDGSFIMLDADDFKRINDSLGHPVGDKVLTAIADVLIHTFKPEDLIGRLGGDEFGVFSMESGHSPVLKHTLQHLLENIGQIYIPEAPHMTVSCSIGIAPICAGDRFDQIYENADRALYCSKKSGKRQISYSDR